LLAVFPLTFAVFPLTFAVFPLTFAVFPLTFGAQFMTNEPLTPPIGSMMVIKSNVSQVVINTDKLTQLNSEFFKKSHRFVFSYIDLAPREHDLVALLLSRIHEDHWDQVLLGNETMSPDYTFTNEVLSDWLGVAPKNLFNCLKSPVLSLGTKHIGIMDGVKKRLKFTPLFKDITYENGVLSISPNDKLCSEWLSLSGGHAQVYHRPFRKLKRSYSKFLYTLLSRFKDGKGKLQRQLLSDLYGLFGLLDENGEHKTISYKNPKTFMHYCIRKSIAEIMEVDDRITFHTCPKSGSVGFSMIKKGTRIIALDFLFSWKRNVLESDEDLIKRLGKREEYTDPITVYLVVRDFEEDSPRCPTVDELLMMMGNPVVLHENGYDFNADFMSNYSFAMACARRINTEKPTDIEQ